MRLWGYQKAVSSLYIRRDSPFGKLLFPESRAISYVPPPFLAGSLFSFCFFNRTPLLRGPIGIDG
jgi:hypothetical protein